MGWFSLGHFQSKPTLFDSKIANPNQSIKLPMFSKKKKRKRKKKKILNFLFKKKKKNLRCVKTNNK